MSGDEYAKAVRVIGGHKSQITRAALTLEKVVTTGTVGPEDVSKVKSAKSMVEKQMAKVEAVIDDLLGNENFTEDVLNELTDYLLDRGNLCEQVGSVLDEQSAPKKADTTVLDTSAIGEALSESLMALQVRQPYVQSDLPTFNGENAEFLPFIETFDFMIHSNDSIPDGMKATYLKRCIKEKGPDGKPSSAHELLKHVVPTSTNYHLMREKLKERFKLGYLNRASYITKL